MEHDVVAGRQEPFGERLRRYREAAGYSQEQLAERAGLSANAIGALERGERKRPYPDTLRRLADALGVDQETRASLSAALRWIDDNIIDGIVNSVGGFFGTEGVRGRSRSVRTPRA